MKTHATYSSIFYTLGLHSILVYVDIKHHWRRQEFSFDRGLGDGSPPWGPMAKPR